MFGPQGNMDGPGHHSPDPFENGPARTVFGRTVLLASHFLINQILNLLTKKKL